MSRNRLLTVFRSTETEKSSPATMPLPYPVIDFIGLRIGPIGPIGPINFSLSQRNELFLVSELKLVKLAILPALAQQFRVIAHLYDTSRFHHHDNVRTAHGRETVSNHDRRSIPHEIADRPLNQALRLRVECGRSLIQNQ